MFNNALLMAAAASGDSLVTVGNSALFDDGNSEYLSRTPSSAGNLRKWTLSLWAYRGDLGTGEFKLWSAINGSNFDMVAFTGNQLGIEINTSTSSSNSLRSTALFRDIGWYHIVVVWDSDNTVATNRIRAWVNGERITSWGTSNFPSSAGVNSLTNSTVLNTLGAKANVSQYFDGYLAESVLIDGLALEPTSFGQYDSTGTFWTPLSSATIKGLTFGTNGFYLDNTTNAQTDASGEGNNFTNNNTVTTTALMSPTQLPRLLWNPLSPLFIATLSQGNTKTASTGGVHEGAFANTNFPKTGKWQTEVLVDVSGSSSAIVSFAIMKNLSSESLNQYIGDNSDAYGFYVYPTNQTFYSGTSALFATGSVARSTFKYQICWDASSGDGTADVYFGIDNTFYDNDGSTDGNPATGANPTIENLDISTSEWSLLGIPYNVGTLQTADEDDWEYSIQSGYTALNLTNIVEQTTRTHSNLEEYFSPILYEGNGAIQRVGQFLPFTNSFTVANSALFNTANEEYFSRTFETPTDQDVWSLSWWMKTGNSADIPRGIMGGATHNKDLIYVTPTALYIAFNGVIDYQIDVYDPASFHHYYLTNNSGTLTFYIDGVSQGTASAPTQTDFNSAVAHTIGAYNGDANWFDGYMSQFVFVDGTVIALSAFGQVDTSTGRWVPKDVTTTLDEASDFGNNGFFLDFANSSDMGNDVSGNNHDFTNNNTVVQVADSPTVNIATFNPNDSAGATFSNGNKSMVTTGSSNKSTRGTIKLPNTGKYYWESNLDVASSASIGQIIGLEGADQSLTTGNTAWTDAVIMAKSNSGSVKINGADLFTTSGVAAINTKFQIAVDLDNNKMWFGVNNSWFNSAGGTDGNPSTGANPTISQDFSGYAPLFGNFNCQQTVRFDSADWTYTQPTDYVSLTQDSLPTGESYQTAFSWIKNRDATDNHMLFDRVRGIYKDVHSNEAAVEVTNVNTLQRFLNGGVQVGNDVQVNTANESYVAWNWYMEATGSGSSNTDGTINTTSTLVDTNLGMSISTYSGTGANATVGHGLGVTPQFILIRGLENTEHWQGFHVGVGPTRSVHLNTASLGGVTSIWFNNTAPTSSVFSLGTAGGLNSSGLDYVAYCFAPSQFTAIGSYEGNSNANGAFIPTVNSLGVPIQPAWFLHKGADTDYLNWYILDSVSQTYNVLGPQVLSPDTNEAAPSTSATYREADFVTGGIKIRGAGDQINETSTHIYMAFGTPIIDVDGRILTGR